MEGDRATFIKFKRGNLIIDVRPHIGDKIVIVEEIDDYKVEITLEEAIQKEPDAADLEINSPAEGKRVTIHQNA